MNRWALTCCLLLVAMLALPALGQDAQRRRGFSVSITEPENQGVVFGKTKVAAEVKIGDPELITKVEFLVGDKTIFVDKEPPYEVMHDFGEESRSWVVRVVAHHDEGITVSDAVITRKLPFLDIERVNRVILWVTAFDRDGNLVKDLTKDDFEIREDGKAVEVLDFHHEERPINLSLVLDTSGSMSEQNRLDLVHDAAGDFVKTIRPIDQAMVIDFDDNVFMIQGLTNDTEELASAIESTQPLGGTAIYDALHAAYRKIGKIEGRKAILLLSDGEDTSSFFGYRCVLEEAKANNALIYTIGLGGASRAVMKSFAENTGGNSFFVKDPEKLGAAYQRIADELGNQYFLTYSTLNESWDGRWIKLKVESKRDGVTVRARKGYFAVRDRIGG